MLYIAQDLFQKFDMYSIRYCVFKSIEHINTDLNGERGDIDLLVHTDDMKKAANIILSNDFYKVLHPKSFDGICFYIGYDFRTNKSLLLHVHTKLRVGRKEKYLHWKVEDIILNNRIIDQTTGIYIINQQDELCLLIFRLILKGKNSNLDDLARLNYLTKKLNINFQNELVKYLETILGDSVVDFSRTEYSKDILKKLNEKYRDRIIASQTRGILGKCQVFRRTVWYKYHSYLSKIRRRLNFPKYQIWNKGKTIAFQGVDGSGKSTQVDMLLNTEFFVYTGIVGIYFGNNQYWIPGLTKAINKVSRYPKVEKIRRLVIGIITSIDRRCRVLKAVLFSIKGNTVVYDRYFYDDLTATEKIKITKVKKSLTGRIYRYLLHGWLGLKPDMVFFLDIDALEAHKRKIDYPIEVTELQIMAYRNIFRNRKEVFTIDATQDIGTINRIVIHKIMDKTV